MAHSPAKTIKDAELKAIPETVTHAKINTSSANKN